jgi:hypothetical protein
LAVILGSDSNSAPNECTTVPTAEPDEDWAEALKETQKAARYATVFDSRIVFMFIKK